MKKVKIKLRHDELDTLIKLIEAQIIQVRWNTNAQKMVAALLGEVWARYIPKITFSYEGRKTVSFTVAQGLAFVEAMQGGYFHSENNWTRNILQINHDRIHKQVA